MANSSTNANLGVPDLRCIAQYLGLSPTSLPSVNKTVEVIVWMFNNTDAYFQQTKWTQEDKDFFANTTAPCLQGELVSLTLSNQSLVTTLTNVQNTCFKRWCVLDPPPPPTECSDRDLDALLFWFLFFLSLLISIVGSFFVRRKSCARALTYGRPGALIPLNMLDCYENRKGLAVTFGLVVNYCTNVIFSDWGRIFFEEGGKAVKEAPGYAGVLIKFICCVMISQVAYPVFIFQAMPNHIIGCVCGIIYVGLWFSLEMFKLYIKANTCWVLYREQGGRDSGVLFDVTNYPLYICLVLILLKFICILVLTIIRRVKSQKKSGEHLDFLHTHDFDWKRGHVYTYVKQLVRRKKKEKSQEEMTIVQRIRSKLYNWNPNFKYSTRMLASLAVCVIAIYIIATFLAVMGWLVFRLGGVESWLWLLEIFAEAAQLKVGVTEIESYFKACEAGWFLGLVLAIIFTLLVLGNSMAYYRRHVLRLRVGDYSFLPKTVVRKQVSPANIMRASFMFAGFQVGYGLWGFIIMWVLMYIIVVAFVTQIVFAIHYRRMTIVIIVLKDAWPALLMGIAVTIIQRLMATYCFMSDELTLAVNNRRAFHIVSYYMFFFNIFIGVFSCLMRIIKGVIFGMVFLQRLQKSTLARQYETMDPGYNAYIGYLLLEHQHANLVLQCFCKLLTESKHSLSAGLKQLVMYKGMDNGSAEEMNMEDSREKSRRKKRARTKWFLFLMLSQNPSLQKYRWHRIDSQRKFEEEKENEGFSEEPLLHYGDHSNCKV